VAPAPASPLAERQAVAARLRAAGYRVTDGRLAVYEAAAAVGHHDVPAIARAARSQLGELSTQGVYDALRVLTALGLVRRIEPAGSPALYESRVADNHHHVVCRTCGAVADVDCAVGAAPCLTASTASGFVVDEAEVTFWGACPTCRLAGSDPTTTRGETPCPTT
jgi:Fe2+ or Zn2+ uptake regulation protein